MNHAIVIDDEIAAVGKLTDLLKDSGMFSIVEGFTNPLEALKRTEKISFDVAFLDIEMPGMDGMTLANHILDTSNRTEIVFVTAYNEYAIKAFELNAMDYLLKPVVKDRLQKSLLRLSESSKKPMLHETLVNVTCFGKFRVEQADGSIVKWRTNKTEEMFAYLMNQNGNWVSKDKMLEDIWGEFEGDRAATNFSTCLYYMRKTLSELGWSDLLIIDGRMYKVDMALIDADILQVEPYLSPMFSIHEDHLTTLEQVLEKAIEGYFEFNYYEWAETRRQVLEDATLQLIHQLAGYYGNAGRENQAVMWLRRGLMKNDTHRDLNYALLKLFIGMNDRVAAQKHYDEYKYKILEEYGLEPDQELVEWFEKRLLRR